MISSEDFKSQLYKRLEEMKLNPTWVHLISDVEELTDKFVIYVPNLYGHKQLKEYSAIIEALLAEKGIDKEIDYQISYKYDISKLTENKPIAEKGDENKAFLEWQKKMLKASGFTQDDLKKTFNDYIDDPVFPMKDRIMKYSQQLLSKDIDNPPLGLYLYSYKNQTGKSFLLKLLFFEILRSKDYVMKNLYDPQKVTIRFITVDDLLDSVKQLYTKGKFDVGDQIFTDFTNIPILMLDDISAVRASKWAVNKLCKILHSRVEARKMTFFTSNDSVTELKERFYQSAIEKETNKQKRELSQAEIDQIKKDCNRFCNRITRLAKRIEIEGRTYEQ